MIRTRISEVLEAQGRTLYWLQKETGIAYNALKKLRDEQTASVEFRVMDQVCRALDCQPGDLFIRVEDEKVKKK